MNYRWNKESSSSCFCLLYFLSIDLFSNFSISCIQGEKTLNDGQDQGSPCLYVSCIPLLFSTSGIWRINAQKSSVLRMHISLKWVFKPNITLLHDNVAQVEDTFFLDEDQTTEANNTGDSLSFPSPHLNRIFHSVLLDR